MKLNNFALKGHKVAKGKTEGEALVSQEPISFLAGVDAETGFIMDADNPLKGTCITGKILIFPVGKGSTASSYRIYEMAYNKTAPNGIINVKAGPEVAAGAIFAGIPMIDRLDSNPLELIKTGDYVILDADNGTVTVKPCPE